MLSVSAPFHCSLMKPAQDRLAADLKSLKFQKPAFRSCAMSMRQSWKTQTRRRDALVRQVTGSVKWEQSVRLLIAKGIQTFIEVGPGKVLCGLMRQIDRSKTCLNVDDEASLQKTLEHGPQLR